MALQLNTRVKELSDKLSSSTGSDISRFSSELESGLTGISMSVSGISNNISRRWQDVVCTRVVNIMHSTTTMIQTEISALSGLNAAATAVTFLNSAADAYVQAYNSYSLSQYSNDSPPNGVDNTNAWYSEKTRIENNVKEKEEIAIAAEEAVKSVFSDSGASLGAEGVDGIDATSVTGKELTEFCKKHHVDQSRVSVKKTKVNINGSYFDVYYVYDNNLSGQEFDNLAFEQYVNESIAQLEKIDSEVLKGISSTDIIFEQTYGCDTGHYDYGQTGIAQAWYVDSNKAVTSWFPVYGSYEDGVGAILHEFGHVLDSAYGYKTQYGYYETDNNVSKWKYLINSEGNAFKNNSHIPGLCAAYGVDKYLESPTEYFAEVFYAYNYSEESRKRLKAVAPQTYSEVERIINNAKG